MTTQLIDDLGACYNSLVGKLLSVHPSWLTL